MKRSLTVVFLLLILVLVFVPLGASRAFAAEDREYVMYTVQDCDSLWDLAGKFYNEPLYWPAIYKHNYDKLWDPDLLYAGQILKIPKVLTGAEKRDAINKANSHYWPPCDQKCSCMVNYTCELLADGPEYEWIKDWGLPAPTFSSKVSTYRVKDGDCLWKIAEEIYGNSFLWPLIYKANLDRIWDPDLIKAGWTLKIITNPTYEEIQDAVYKAVMRPDEWSLTDGPECEWVGDWTKKQ